MLEIVRSPIVALQHIAHTFVDFVNMEPTVGVKCSCTLPSGFFFDTFYLCYLINSRLTNGFVQMRTCLASLGFTTN